MLDGQLGIDVGPLPPPAHSALVAGWAADLAARVLDAGLSWRAATGTAYPRLALSFWVMHGTAPTASGDGGGDGGGVGGGEGKPPPLPLGREACPTAAAFTEQLRRLTRPEALAADAARWLQVMPRL